MANELLNCAICEREIRGLYVWTSKQEKSHKECFKCSTCSLPFPDGEYVLVDGTAFDQLCGERSILDKKGFEQYDYYEPSSPHEKEADDEMTRRA